MVAKPLTAYITSTADATALKWTLNSTLVTLNSTTARLNGYFTADAPNQLNNKPPTTYVSLN